MSSTYKVRANSRDTDEEIAAREAKRLADAEAKERWDDPEFKAEVAADMTETIYWGFKHENVLQRLSTVENVEPQDRIFVKEVRGFRAFWVSRGGNIDESTYTEEVAELQRDLVGFHVSELDEKLESNFSETQATMVDQAIDAVDAAVNQRVLNTFKAAIPDASSPWFATANGLSLNMLNDLITGVQEESMQDEVTIVGRATMTGQIMNALQSVGNVFAPNISEDIIRTGFLGAYRGANIVKLRNYRDQWNQPFVPGNELYVLAPDASKAGFWGTFKTQEWNEQGGWYWHYMGRREFGFMVHHPERARRFVDTSKPA